MTPHYAVKCCPDRGIISTLAALGAGFDCASQGEVELIKELGIDVDKIILAHAVKRPADLRCIAEHGVKFTTFDSESELHKMFAARLNECKLVLRIKADDPMAKISFGRKIRGAHGRHSETFIDGAIARYGYRRRVVSRRQFQPKPERV